MELLTDIASIKCKMEGLDKIEGFLLSVVL